ncbi:MAG: aconitate hydratase AcnA [Terriglobia bacterium]
MAHHLFDSLESFSLGNGKKGQFYSLPRLEAKGIGKISRLPISIRIVLESVLRNFDGKKIQEGDIHHLANWQPSAKRTEEIPFVVARIVLQDFTGVPLLVDLAAMRSACSRLGKNVKMIEPLVPVDLVVDHSIQVDVAGTPGAFRQNMELEFKRNNARYQFLKWGMQAFEGFRVVPPGIGIVHQVNLEYLAKGVLEKEGVFYPDTLVGTDSHTTMINGLGIVGWGVGGIEAEAGMLGQPVYFLTPDVVGVHLQGTLREGVTATDLVLNCTERLRKEKVVGKFVEFFGQGTASLPAMDRATIANMAPEYGATMGFFPMDEETCKYLLATGRSTEQVEAFRSYFKAQEMFGVPKAGQCDYSSVVEIDLQSIQPSVAGPKRPQDRIELSELRKRFTELFEMPVAQNGYNKPKESLQQRFSLGNGTRPLGDVGHGDVLIAAITSCTNTSNPSVMLAAGLVAKKAVEKGLNIRPTVKTSLAPGSRVVTDYLAKTGLQPYLDRLGFNLVGYGCTTCIGNSGPLDPKIEEALTQHDLVAASVLSGNRNFEARVHQLIKANFLMSPPLVVAFALAGRVDINLADEPLGRGSDGKDVYLREIWPTLSEVRELMAKVMNPESFHKLYANLGHQNPLWDEVPSSTGEVYPWDTESTYIQEPPFFEDFSMELSPPPVIKEARALAIFGDSVTTDHISPAGAIKKSSPAGLYLQEKGVQFEDFNSYGSRRGNDRVMTRGTFANVRIKNLMVPGVEGGVTVHQPDRQSMSIYDAAMKYQSEGVPLLIFAGQEYGTGSSRDWAAKGTKLLGVKAVVAQSYERIHRSNLVGMGVLPCQFKEGTSAQSISLDGTEVFGLEGLKDTPIPHQDLTLVVQRASGVVERIPLTLRIDTPIEVEYYLHGGILPYVLKQLVGK